MVNPRILNYETLIVVSQLKMHATATVTLALKNIAMSFPAADYYGHPRATQQHRHQFMEDLHSFIAAMHHRFPAYLAITGGHPAMVATGPIGGYTAETGLVPCTSSSKSVRTPRFSPSPRFSSCLSTIITSQPLN